MIGQSQPRDRPARHALTAEQSRICILVDIGVGVATLAGQRTGSASTRDE